jgi:hypothetical protein
VDVTGEGTTGECYVEGVRAFLDQAGRRLADGPPRFDRFKPLLAVQAGRPGEPDAPTAEGRMIAALLSVLRTAARKHDVDIALVASDGPAYAAAQAARHQREAEEDPWPELDGTLRQRAQQLAALASAGEPALFVGVGISASAGLPLWGQLLEKLAEKAGMAEDEREALGRLNPLDQAALIENRLGGRAGL